MEIRNRILPLVVIATICLAIPALHSRNPTLVPTASYPATLNHVIVADLHGDNAPEIVGLDNNSRSLVVLLNLGDGTYETRKKQNLD